MTALVLFILNGAQYEIRLCKRNRRLPYKAFCNGRLIMTGNNLTEIYIFCSVAAEEGWYR